MQRLCGAFSRSQPFVRDNAEKVRMFSGVEETWAGVEWICQHGLTPSEHMFAVCSWPQQDDFPKRAFTGTFMNEPEAKA